MFDGVAAAVLPGYGAAPWLGLAQAMARETTRRRKTTGRRDQTIRRRRGGVEVISDILLPNLGGID